MSLSVGQQQRQLEAGGSNGKGRPLVLQFCGGLHYEEHGLEDSWLSGTSVWNLQSLSVFLAALICPSALLSPLPPTSQLLSSSCFLSCETAGLSQPRGCCQADSGIPASAGTAPGSQGCGPKHPLLLRSQRAQEVTQDLGPRHSWHHSGVGREQVGLLED